MTAERPRSGAAIVGSCDLLVAVPELFIYFLKKREAQLRVFVAPPGGKYQRRRVRPLLMTSFGRDRSVPPTSPEVSGAIVISRLTTQIFLHKYAFPGNPRGFSSFSSISLSVPVYLLELHAALLTKLPFNRS